MKNKLLLLTVFISGINLFSQPNWDWGRYGGGAGNDIAYAIATDPAGFSYVTGRFNASLTMGSHTVSSYGGPDIFVAKYDPAGNCLWLRHGGSLDGQDIYGDESRGIGLDAAGNCYVTGNYKGTATFGSLTIGSGSSRNIYVVKYDPNGNEIWAQSASSGMYNHYSRAIAVDSAGNSWITGYLGGGTTSFGSYSVSGAGGYVIKYDPNGNALFASKFGGGAIDLYGIAVDNAGNSYTTGYLQGGDMIGSQTFTSNGMRDAVLIKTDAAGSFSWLTQSWTLPNSYVWSNAVCCDQQNGVYICGHYDNTCIFGNDTLHLSAQMNMQDLFLVKYDSNGNELWAVQSDLLSNGGGQLDAMAITSDQSSDIFITGAFGEDMMLGSVLLANNNTGVNTFIAAFTSSGFCQYAIASTGQNPGAYGQGISTDYFGGVYIAGFDKSTVIFGTDTTQVIGSEDVFVARIGAHGKDGIEDHELHHSVSLLPSGSGNWILNFEEPDLANEDLSFALYDMTGRLILEIPVSGNNQQIKTGNLAAGMYSWSVFGSKKRIDTGKIAVN